MTNFTRLSLICVLAAVPALADNELWSVVQGITPGTLIEVQLKDVKHRGVLTAATEKSVSLNTGTGEMSLLQPQIRKVKVARAISGAGLSWVALSVPQRESRPLHLLAPWGQTRAHFEPATVIGAGAVIGFGIGAGVGVLTALAPATTRCMRLRGVNPAKYTAAERTAGSDY
jgi:hypothetical protein